MCGRIGVSEGMSMGGMWSGGMEPSRCRDRSCSGGAVPLSMLCSGLVLGDGCLGGWVGEELADLSERRLLAPDCRKLTYLPFARRA